jgi:hypothetical protein
VKRAENHSSAGVCATYGKDTCEFVRETRVECCFLGPAGLEILREQRGRCQRDVEDPVIYTAESRITRAPRTWLFFSKHCQCFSNSVLQLSLIFLILELQRDGAEVQMPVTTGGRGEDDD